ncbi:MAG TPA: DUF3626 domain-containing protein [Arthrobacter sp.]|nr:DUF3626 domain-containing protein [Arthrobacter sp.]
MAEVTSRWAREAVQHVASRSEGGELDRSLRVTFNFHPDREVDGVPMLELLGRDGVYRNQFETGTSNGGLTAYRGGARWLWERRIFGGVYDEAPPAQRPKYGALNHRRRQEGGAARFGSAHLRLSGDALERTTFCFPDSVLEPASFGTAFHLGLIELADAFSATERTEAEEAEFGGRLDDYIEAHVHGVIDLSRDVEALVLDPCYQGTAVEAMADRLPVPVEWHRGFRLTVDELRRHQDFRGSRIVSLGHMISQDGWLDAKIIGEALHLPGADPQDLKKVWHYVVRFGGPARR